MKPLIVAIIALLAAGLVACGQASPLPTRAAPAVPPPTPPVMAVTPTVAAVALPPPATAASAVAPVEMATAATATTATTAATAATAPTDATPQAATPAPPPTPIATPATATAAPCATPGRVEAGELLSAVAGGPMRYRVYLPPCYGDDGRVYPTLYLFGGNVHDETFWDTLGIDEAAAAAIVAGQLPPLLIVMPDNGWLANTTTSGPASYEGFVLNELVPHIESAYCAWPAREGRAVGGVSRGGYWSLMMAFRRPDLFRSVGAHSPALIDSFAGSAEDPRLTAASNLLGDLRIWVDIGERDPYLAAAQPLHEALTAAGVAHEWRVNPGIHENAYWAGHLSDYLLWYGAGFPADRAALPACP